MEGKMSQSFLDGSVKGIVCKGFNIEYEDGIHKMKNWLDSLGLKYLKIRPLINSDIYCIELKNQQWGAMRIGEEQPVIPFGKYKHLFGYDGGFCLVNAEGMSGQTHEDRGIVDSDGVGVVPIGKYDAIWDFYGKSFTEIRTEDGEFYVELSREDPTIEEDRYLRV